MFAKAAASVEDIPNLLLRLFVRDAKSPRCTGRTQGYLGHGLERCCKVREPVPGRRVDEGLLQGLRGDSWR